MTRKVALWGLIAVKTFSAWGLTWDIQWHLTIGRDTFWIAPHLMMYSSVVAALILSFGALALETQRARAGQRLPGAIRLLGLTGARGLHLAAWGVALVILAAPIDDLWHRLFGLDVTLWSPPHLLGLFGSAVNTLGAIVLATEVYPARSLARRVALVLACGLFYGGVRVVLEPAWLTAYVNGGVAFHAVAMLGALVLPLALVPAARLVDRRWAPLVVVVVAVAVSITGEQIARAGFAVLQPESVIAEEITKDPTSPIALSARIRAQNQGAQPPLAVRLLLPLLPAAAMTLVDVRRRTIAACVAYSVTMLAANAWFLAQRPAFAPLVPTPAETAVAVGITVVAAILGAAIARRLSDGLEPAARRAAPGAVPHPAA